MLSFNEELVYYATMALIDLRDTSKKVTDLILRSNATNNGIKIQLAKLRSLNIRISRAKGRAKKLICYNYKASESEKSLAAELLSEVRKSEVVAEVLERKILLDLASLAVAKSAAVSAAAEAAQEQEQRPGRTKNGLIRMIEAAGLMKK